jgi:hypothetical protein
MKIKPIDNPQTKLKNRINFGKKDETCPFCVKQFTNSKWDCHFLGIVPNENYLSWGARLNGSKPCKYADWLVCPFAVAIESNKVVKT